MNMKSHPNKLNVPPAIFDIVVKHTPLVSIDLVVSIDGKLLVGERLNRPARGTLFVPGGRIHKDESIECAFRRIAGGEIGLSCGLQDAKFLGVFEHFYDDSALDEESSTHYVVLAYGLECNSNMIDAARLYTQHRLFTTLTPSEVLNTDNVHYNTKAYAAFI